VSPDLQSLRSAAIADHHANRLAAAAAAYARYLAKVPQDAAIWSNLGALHRTQGRHMAALRAHRRATALAPDDAGIANNLANTLSDIGQYRASLALRWVLLAASPQDKMQIAMIGRCLRGMGDYDAAITHLTAARTAHPDDAEIQMQLAFAQLGQGDYANGFESYRARWRAGELTPRQIDVPEWQAEPLQGKTLLVLTEQGFGDAVLFARFLGVAQDTGARVVLALKPPLFRLFQGVDGVDLVTTALSPDDRPDYWVNIMDLAQQHFALGGTVPSPVSLHVPQESSKRARAMTAPYRDKFRVGVVWSGSTTYKGNTFRSFSHTDMLPLSDVAGVQLFSLYKGPLLADFVADGTSAFIVDASSTDRDFADCAAMMQQMDLIITSDTATAHIAGSLGVPVWTILHWDPFWVWRHAGDATQWYPGMRLFRQKTPLHWDQVMDEVARALSAQVETA
jgi:tetratricopeptide (TPR) repeat protein